MNVVRSMWYWSIGLALVLSMSVGCSCGAPPSTCALLDCFGECIDPHTSVKHCGACNRPCGAGQSCKGGKCIDGSVKKPSCQDGLSRCGDSCVDLKTSQNNCGQCGLVCADSTCINGQCDSRCRPGLHACGTRCVDLQSSPTNCGSCNVACADGAKCVSGKCEVAEMCPPARVLCGALCVNLQTDASNCGKCGNVCEIGCSSGSCISPNGCKSKSDCPTDKICDVDKGECVAFSCRGGECPRDLVCDRNTNLCVGAKCVKDADCPPGALCIEGQCKWPECKNNTHCPDDFLCNTKTLQCVERCKADSDCATGQVCNVSSGLCETSSATGKVGDPCHASSGVTCQAGLICLNIFENEAYCFERCQGDADCAGNAYRKSCIRVASLNNQALRLCLGIAKEGESCSYKGARQAQCAQDTDPPLYCDIARSVCTRPIVQKKAGLPCTRPGDNSSPRRVCDESLRLVCNPYTTMCVQTKVSGEGGACDLDGSGNQGVRILCLPGYTCVEFSPGLQRCHRSCTLGQPGQCQHRPGMTCRETGHGVDVCVDTSCTKDSDCALPDYTCKNKACVPKDPSGPVAFGGVCRDPKVLYGCNLDPNNGGDPKLICVLASQQTGIGYCSRDCTQDGKCPAWNGTGSNSIASVCIQATGTAKYCLFPCGKPGQSCPSGLTCQKVGSSGLTFCLAP